MSATINIFHDIFTIEPETKTVESGKPIYELVSVDFENSLIYVSGYEKDKNYILADGDICTIRVFPAFGLGDVVSGIKSVGKNVGKTVGNAFTSVGNFIAHPVTHLQDFGKWTKTTLGNFFSWLMSGDEPTSNNKEDYKSIPTLEGAKNQSGYGKAIPMVLGSHLFTPYYCGTPYHTISADDDGETQTYHALFMLGYNDVKVTDIKFGSVILAHNQPYVSEGAVVPVTTVYNGDIAINGRWKPQDYNIHLELQQGANEVSLYPQKVVEEELGIELMHTSDDVKILELNRFSAKNPQKIQVEVSLEGLIKYNDDGESKDASVSVQIEISFDGGNTYSPFGKLNGSNISYDGQTGISTITRKKNKMMRFYAERELSYSEAINCTNRTAELRIKRTNKKDDGSNTADTMYLSAIRTWCYDYEKSIAQNELVPQVPVIESRRNMTARLGLQLEADEIEFKNQIDELNCILTARGRTWDGTSWSSTTTETSNPASMLLRLLQHESRGKYKYDDAKLIMTGTGSMLSLAHLYEWSNQPREAGDNTPKFQCNGILTSTKKTREIVDAILACARAKLVVSEGKYGAWIDEPRTVPVMVLNNQNILEASNTKSFNELADGYKVKFVNEMTWQTDERKVLYDTSKATDPKTVYQQLELLFQTDAKQIWQNTMYIYATEKLRPETWTRKVSVDGNLLDIGSLVELQDDTISVGIGDGAEITELITNGNYIVGVKTDGMIYVSELGHNFGIRVTCADGIHVPKVMSWEVNLSSGGMQSIFMFKSPILTTSTYKPNVGDILSFGIFERETTQALCFGKKDNGDGTFELTLVPYQEGIYTADSGTIPEFDSKVTDIPMNTGGTIPTDVPQIYPTFEQVRNISLQYGAKFVEIEAADGLVFKNNAPQSLTLTVVATGFIPTSYQWYKNNAVIEGAVEATYSATSAGVYKVEVDGAYTDFVTVISVTDGEDVGYQEYEFSAGNKDTYPYDDSEWFDAPPRIESGKFLWMRTRWVNRKTEAFELSDNSNLILNANDILYVDTGVEAWAYTRLSGDSVLAQYSSDGLSWHSNYESGDIYMRTSTDNGGTWTEAVRIVGEGGYACAISNENFSIATDVELKPVETKNYDVECTAFKGTQTLTAVTGTPTEGQFSVSLPSGFSRVTASTIRFTASTQTAIQANASYDVTVNFEGKSSARYTITVSAGKAGEKGEKGDTGDNGVARVLTSLLDAGTEGEVAIYYGSLFRDSGRQWTKIDTDSYLGALASFPQNFAIDAFFLSTSNFSETDTLMLSNNTNLVLSNGGNLELSILNEAGLIWKFTETGWSVIKDRNDWHYLVAVNDLIKYGYEVPASYKTLLSSMVAQEAPRYLGAMYHEPYQYKEGDWFCWAGETTASRENGRVYKLMRVNGELAWVKLDENDTANHAEFMSALNDILLLHKAEAGYFSTVFANALIAHEVFADYVKTNQLEIAVDELGQDISAAQSTANSASSAASAAQNDINGIKNTDAAAVNAAKTPAIKSSNWLQSNFTPSDTAGGIGEDNNTAGFCIMKNGDAYFNNASLRGRLKMEIYDSLPSDLQDGEIFLYSVS